MAQEFERQPVPKSSLLGFRSFIGMYAGEHCAGTELLIGPMFVAAGVSAFDVIVGLIVGNLLAVICWMLMCAPIAVRARLTLYYQLEKICGSWLVILYNLANGIMFCFLAGAMITVSATAIGVWGGFPMPELGDTMPNGLPWILSAAGVGLAISIVAALGYKTVSKFANIAAPWMVLVFLAFGLVALRQFIVAGDTPVSTPGELWKLCNTSIWQGSAAVPGETKFTFWHVMFFAWFCNMAMHVGMSDLSVFRFAKKSWYGSAAGAGMFVGHFMAWIAASLMFAFPMFLFLQSHNVDNMEQLLVKCEISADNPEVAKAEWKTVTEKWTADYNAWEEAGSEPATEPAKPFPSVAAGPLAYGACGIAGLICVIIAGWTTANPTIYRAGLAFQAIIPKTPRMLVTFVTGLIATTVGVFPAVAMQLLGFVALYGLVLMPMGAVVFVDFWLIPKLGLKQYFAAQKGLKFNWAAGAAWILTFVICVGLVKYAGVQIFFVSLPGWFIAVAIYIVLSFIEQRRLADRPDIATKADAEHYEEVGAFGSEEAGVTTPEIPEKQAFGSALSVLGMIGSGIALAALIIPPVLYLGGHMDLPQMKTFMLIATIAWFVISPLWMWKSGSAE